MTSSRRLARPLSVLLTAAFALLPLALHGQYFPPRGEWERRAPEQVGMDPAAIAAAVEYAAGAESGSDRDLEMAHEGSFGREPLGFPVGPFSARWIPGGAIDRLIGMVVESIPEG